MDTIEILRALTKHPEQTISHHAFIALQLSCTRLLEDNDMESLLGSNIVEAICDQIQSLVPGPTRNSAFALIETICIKMDNLSEEDIIQLNSQVILDEDTTRAKERVRTLKHTTREQREKLEKILKQKEHQEQQAQKYIAILSHLEAEQLTLDHPDICQSPHANPTSTSSPKTTERSLIPTQIESARSTELPSPVKANVKITLPNDLTRIPWMPFDSSTYHFENNRVSKMHRTHGCLVSSVFMKGLYVFYLRFESISGQFVLGIIDPCEVEDAKTKNFGDMTTGIGYSLATTFTVRNQKYVTGGHEKFVPGDEISLIVDTRNRDDDKRIMAITRNGVVQSTALSSLPAQFSLVLSMGKRGTTATIHGMRRGKDTIKGYENIRDGTES
ncbi:hypothetical protein BLNAU_12629 [Blattamonas nauphoetae]|uniref:Uncharacterized protein n=1 Tax=Blattamonas nauphoetae TaxID=2049346 RepID=A0ABQ9XLU6_9EUKA|nr:hypothetical protein BLNAU_12629 [Blattamonas nauphoetae]